MKHSLYPMDTCFMNSFGIYPFAARCEITKELGYDGMHITGATAALEVMDAIQNVEKDYGLGIGGMYHVLNMGEEAKAESIEEAKKLVVAAPAGARIELGINYPHDRQNKDLERETAEVCSLLNDLLYVAAAKEILIGLYPHIWFWLEKAGQAIELCEKIKHPNLGLVFSGFHWYAADKSDLKLLVSRMLPHLHSVNLCGTKKGEGVGGFTIEPIDTGEMDNFSLLCLLKKHGYTGQIGFQGYSAGGDAYVKLKRNIETFRSMEARAEAHPEWSALA